MIKNILVNEKEIYIDLLIRKLINNNISYCKIENEIHFLGNIYRFYDKNDIHIINLDFIPVCEFDLTNIYELNSTKIVEYKKEKKCNINSKHQDYISII